MNICRDFTKVALAILCCPITVPVVYCCAKDANEMFNYIWPEDCRDCTRIALAILCCPITYPVVICCAEEAGDAFDKCWPKEGCCQENEKEKLVSKKVNRSDIPLSSQKDEIDFDTRQIINRYVADMQKRDPHVRVRSFTKTADGKINLEIETAHGKLDVELGF